MSDRISLVVGAAMLLAGVVLATTTRGVHVPVVSPAKVGVVLTVLGAAESLIAAAVLLARRVRR